MTTAFIILVCTVIVVGFFLEVAVGHGDSSTILPPPDEPPPDDPPNEEPFRNANHNN